MRFKRFGLVSLVVGILTFFGVSIANYVSNPADTKSEIGHVREVISDLVATANADRSRKGLPDEHVRLNDAQRHRFFEATATLSTSNKRVAEDQLAAAHVSTSASGYISPDPPPWVSLDFTVEDLFQIAVESVRTGALAGVGTATSLFLLLSLIYMTWRFLLARVAELSDAIRGKRNE